MISDKLFPFIMMFFWWAVFSLSQTAIGVIESSREDCKKSMLRIEYLFPGYRLGCWLGERVE